MVTPNRQKTQFVHGCYRIRAARGWPSRIPHINLAQREEVSPYRLLRGLGSVPGPNQPIEVNIMNTKQSGSSRITLTALAMAGVATLGLSGVSHAGCAPTSFQSAPSSGATASADPSGFIRTAWRGPDRAIVGLWKFEMLSKSTSTNKNPMPEGTLIDFGTAAWHGDGTEFQTSGFRNPSDGDTCQGVWQQVGHSTFVLNHVALAWTNGAYTGPANIRARVTVSPDGSRYTGTFTTTVYLAAYVAGHEFDQKTVLAVITGTFDATRVTMQ